MSSEENLFESSTPTVHEFDDTQIRRLSVLLPLILRLTSRERNPEPRSGVGIVMIDRASGTIVVIDGSGDLESTFQELSGKPRVLPASKDSIEAMPRVAVTEEGMECAICLEAYMVGGEAREMPCRHRFHSGCIEKWLGINGSCPVCRFLMPVEENKSSTASEDDEQDGGERRGSGEGVLSVRIWVRYRGGDDPMNVDWDSIGGSGDSNSNTDKSQDGNSAVDENQESQDMES